MNRPVRAGRSVPGLFLTLHCSPCPRELSPHYPPKTILDPPLFSSPGTPRGLISAMGHFKHLMT